MVNLQNSSLAQFILGMSSSIAHAGKNVFLFVSTTGFGQSTLIEYLRGSKMVGKLQGRSFVVDVSEDTVPITKIGHGLASITHYPTIVPTENGMHFCDCPGLNADNSFKYNPDMSL